jgi:hypothetical protein
MNSSGPSLASCCKFVIEPFSEQPGARGEPFAAIAASYRGRLAGSGAERLDQ